MSQVTGKKVATTPMPTPSGTSGAIIDSFNTQDDQTVNAPSIHIVKDALTTINDKLTENTGTISGNLGFTIKWVKWGNVVTLRLDNDTTRIPVGKTVITNLPSNLAPAVNCCAESFRNTLNKCSFVFGADGQVVITAEGADKYYIGCSITYVTN